MTLYKIYAKLRRFHLKNYTSLFFSMMLSVVLVTSYALIYYSPTVQTILPAGGDSRKQAVMIFAAALIGCAMFAFYASTLFYKNKSRDTGIFFALGADKSKLKKMIFTDVLMTASAACAAGLIVSFPAAWGIWNIFRLVIVDSREMVYRFGYPGLLLGIVFCLLASLCIFLLGIKFAARTNIMDIINENRKSEPVKDVKAWYGLTGVILMAAGLLLGFIVPTIMIRYFSYYLPSLWNVTYGLSVIGVYMFMVYIVVHNKRGRRPDRYYKNIISTSMMRFMGKQTVKNMCVIILLVFGADFAVFYTPVILTGVEESIKKNPYDFSYTYEQRIPQVDRQELYEMAEEYGIEMKNYYELEAIDLIVDGEEWVNSDLVSGKIEHEYVLKYWYARFVKASDIERLTGKKVELNIGEYALISTSETADTKQGDIGVITDPVTEVSRKVSYSGNIVFDGSLAAGILEDIYVISDKDYEAYYKDLPIENKYRSIFFNVDDWEEHYDFAKALKDEIIKRTPVDAAVFKGYNRYLKKLAEDSGEIYYMDTGLQEPGVGALELSPENSQLYTSWRYYPEFKPLKSQDSIKNMAVFLMLFIYIGIICFAAVGVIAYTRGITIAVNYKQVFVDLKRLGGADRNYVGLCIRNQLKKIFFYPYLVGSGLIYAFTILIFKANDRTGMITAAERQALFIDLGMILLAGIYIGGIYLLTYRKFRKTIGMDDGM